MAVGAEKLHAPLVGLERHEAHAPGRHLHLEPPREAALPGLGPELPGEERLVVRLAELVPVDADLGRLVRPVEERHHVPRAERTLHREVPHGEVAELRVEVGRTHVRHRQRLLEHLDAPGGEFAELVAREGLLARQRHDGRLHARLLVGERLVADHHAVGVGPEHDRVREVLVDRAARLEEDVVPANGLVGVHDVRARARRVRVRRLGTGEVSLAGKEHAVGPDAVAERLHAELEGVGAGRVGEAGADIGPLVEVRAVAGAASAHAVDLEELVAPVVRGLVEDLLQVRARGGHRGVERELAVPAGNRLAVLAVQEPVRVRLVEVRVARAERRHPEAGTEPELADLAREPLHALGELLRVRLEVHVVELGDGQLARVLLPALDGPEFEPERLEVLLPEARLGEVLLRAGLVEVDVPAHPAGRWTRRARAVDRGVVRHPAAAVVVALHLEGDLARRGVGDRRGEAELPHAGGD